MFSKKKQEVIKRLITHTLPLCSKEELPLIFFWTPKSGCTSLIKWYFFQLGLLQQAIDYNDAYSIHQYRIKVFETQEDYKVKIAEQLLRGKKDVFKLVRNPYKRTVSSFLSTLNNKVLMSQVAPGAHNGLSFKQFLYQIKKLGVGKGSINLHIAQQYIEEEELFIKNYIPLENFESEIKAIEKKYNLLDSPILDIMQSPHHRAQKMTNKNNKIFAEINMSQESLKKPLPDYKYFYDAETIDLVRELFKKDIINYGYDQHILN
ncbi:sulfotransferase family 2 domain-containing protein [Alteribacillus bidgolensis]|uniref:Sulfotransferase family protein n=1 Tax=Alteribacillus bidgolensis TaxID=930129 RepID=A0A1G8RJJ4_9BACI|nr:sulfotransferase family 2 domain-containing protein [Alteribacillus bidgolensis]SDJ17111.1 Sulfotransferase family protein [Alteribacillus bidgolensis]